VAAPGCAADRGRSTRLLAPAMGAPSERATASPTPQSEPSEIEGESSDIGASVLLIAIGAILLFAVTASIAGVSINAIGVILMIAGAVGLLISLTTGARREPF
jgi:hypothetical protein